jgi:hypothetical protein
MKFMLAIIASLALSACIAQPAVQFSYGHIRSPEWDAIVQTYNTSRPWNSNKLEPLTHGGRIQLCYNLPLIFSRATGLNSRALHMNYKLGYARFFSSTENLNFKTTTGINHFNISFDVRTHPKCIFKPVQTTGPLGTKFYFGLGMGFGAFMPFIQQQGKLIEGGDQEKYREISYNLYYQAITGIHLMTIGSFTITPEMGLNWHPKAELVDFAESLNGHNLTGMKNTSRNVLFFDVGIRITYLKKKSNWWDRPRSGDKT